MSRFGYALATAVVVALCLSGSAVAQEVIEVEDFPSVYEDIATVYYYGNGVTRIHTWINNNGEGFEYTGSNGWFNTNKGGYEANRLKHCVMGDWNGDGLDDIAGFYDYGNTKTALHVWLNDGLNKFSYQTSRGWWRVERGYDVNNLVQAVAGDYNGDGYDDIAGFYNYGNGKIHIHVWLSDGVSTFDYQGSDGWWRVSSGYSGENIQHIVSGEFAP